VGHGELCANATELLRHGPGEAVLVGDADDETLSAGEIENFLPHFSPSRETWYRAHRAVVLISVNLAYAGVR
jgi:hypothetical protein